MVLSTTLQRWRHLRHCTDSSTYKQTPLSTEQWSSRAHSQNCEGPTPELVRHALALVWSQSRWTANGQKTQDWCSGDKVMTHAQLAPPSRFPWEGQRVETETEGMYDWHSSQYALSQHCQMTLCLEELSQLQTPHAPMWWRSPLVVTSEGTTVLCQPMQRTLSHVWLTQQTALLAAGQLVPDPKQAYLFDLLIT